MLEKMLNGMPLHAQRKVEATMDNINTLTNIKNKRVMASLGPSVVRGMFRKQGKKYDNTGMVSEHAVDFDWTYKMDFPEMQELYRRAVGNQWDGDKHIDWSIDVDPLNPHVPIIADRFIPMETLREHGVKLTTTEFREFNFNIACWILSQMMHGEQGALYASCQVTEAVRWFDGKLYGATQVVDEARHLEVFMRYLDTKLGKLYDVNDNMFSILDGLLTDSRWDIKFLGMQIMVEGLALGAFTTVHNMSKEPLLKSILRYVIQDEARHVHYGVLALKKTFEEELTPSERRERQEWAFEVAVLMRNRFLGHEIYEEWFEGIMTRKTWNKLISESDAMNTLRKTMFKRLVPNLECIGLLPDSMLKHYEEAGLTHYMGGKSAMELTDADMMADLH
ncbi:hypothetical protein CS022_01395 [Veronia nyctiphanis]|uniref:Ferritin-like domain-containing protein n=1 Tax=Veronia nyctiphanis TaxID=1278244 RepID=A0A4Q0YVH3_9GAMM|nr:ferritin-like domain-containing protein [Veronia nyctiphanis]RXJ74883.1 hypothetical protein CS022_01395 [Veronia nyctiphanis]